MIEHLGRGQMTDEGKWKIDNPYAGALWEPQRSRPTNSLRC